MNRIAIIDTAIDAERIGRKDIEYINLCEETSKNEAQKVSHGTMCAMVLDHCTSNYELVNIRIFEGDVAKAYTDVGALAKALELCKDLKIDIVSLSAVSSILSDTKYLYDITCELSKNTIIVSALDNIGYVTVPTSYPHVIGVKSDFADLLELGGVAVVVDDPLGVNVYANCNYECLYECDVGPSNSFAVPVVVGYINELLNQGLPKSEIESCIQLLPTYTFPEKNGNDVPIVFLENLLAGELLRILDIFHSEYETQSTALLLGDAPYDIRVKPSSLESLVDDLHFMELHYKTDLIFISGNEKQLKKTKKYIGIDAVLTRIAGDFSKIRYEDVCKLGKTDELIDNLHEILTT